MSSQLIYEAITNISDHYIEEADPEAGNGWRTQIRRIRPILNMAAVLLVVVGISAVAIDLGLFGRAKSERQPQMRLWRNTVCRWKRRMMLPLRMLPLRMLPRNPRKRFCSALS